MFKVSTLDLANLPRTPEGKIDLPQDFLRQAGRRSPYRGSSTSRRTAWR